ncbi:prolipoprotein diacylglyceryl transferase [Liquorilactobacillus mali]|uniref:Phosphatidylglycerol--prolipoprotein diacylglyceryl transferase n=1 Tax=Liquorilactobacillus mali KCTC 3596 = DSM 20444 TaxID=1046596 RepID=J1F3V1_9LACO|nr:prolipoprotein diacylglyceryl transferase [Liquorilactobacillus mali]EJF00192.1 Prolipoprotein diacylglyceryl transferase [Liquorilactobacillus mali KCTC 3596 = DSM 20444]KRN09596.1 Prolipoprotein diacylglyceryl transferase [Liquorilactobacillus mali KCTC 3596 = DSM 20444]QFQ74203.1 prolipoprotein diacylglyceryl transferase [Liquorilactobacillus mali]
MPILGALNPVAFSLGSIEVRWYGIIIASAVVIATYLSVREGKKRGIVEDDIYDLILWGLPVAIICARIYYVVFEWGYYSQNLSQIYRIWDGGIAIYGGLIGAVIVLVILCKKRNISSWLMLDVAAPTVIMAQGIGRWGNFMNQEAHGRATTLSFLRELHLPDFIIKQMNIAGTYYQPTFLYESVWDLTGFVLLMLLRHQEHLFKRGEVFFAYVIWYSFGRFFIEGMRTDSLMLGPLRVSQWLSVVLFLGAIIWLATRRYWRPLNPWYLDGTDETYHK